MQQPNDRRVQLKKRKKKKRSIWNIKLNKKVEKINDQGRKQV